MKYLSTSWLGVSLATRNHIERAFYSLINLPIMGDVYRFVYCILIRRRASDGLNEMEIETHNICNLRCVMCPYPATTREKTQMDMDLFRKIIDDAAQSGIRRVCLNFYSEPLLDLLLFERIKYAKGKGLKVEFYCNGTLLTEDKISGVLESGLDTIIFSLDGATQETYERIRVGASFEQTQNNIMRLLQERKARGLKKPTIVAYMVVQKDNCGEIRDFESFWNKFADAVWTGEVDARRTGEVMLENPHSGKVQLKRPYPCKSIFKRLEVMSNGKVALCPYDYDGSVVLGDLTTETIKQVWNSRKYKAIRRLHLKGQGDRMKLCRNTGCQDIYRGAYAWWRWQRFG